MSPRGRHHRSDLNDIARRSMREKGLDPDFPKDALAQLERIEAPAREEDPAIRDLRDLLWASIDNDDSR
ncbi:MAG: RNB domain-containing ribonuclease, partial [Thermoanaerobaculia bacterium]